MVRKRLPADDSPILRGREYEFWEGTPLETAPFLAFDTETDVVDLTREVPRLACLTATNGRRTVIVSPEQVASFVRMHEDANWVAFNASFDYWVVMRELEVCWEEEASYWEGMAADGRLRDAMILDFLVALGEGRLPEVRGLGRASKDILRADIDKKDPYRLRFGETIGKDWAEVDPGFWQYAVRDVIVTWELYHRLYQRAMAVRSRSGVSREVWEAYGPLTETLQVQAAVSLEQIGREGMLIDVSKALEARARLSERVAERVRKLDADHYDLFRRYKEKKRRGQHMVNAGTGVPKLNLEYLRGVLAEVAVRSQLDPERLPRTPKTRALQTSLDLWREIAPEDPFIQEWSGLMDDSKLLQFLVNLTTPGEDGQYPTTVHATYVPLVRTGRTSCKKPNIQQIPRDAWFRELFVARPGHRLIIVDYAAIELRTLASVCYDRFGWSVLGDQIKAGRDPHCYTAAMVGGWSYEEVVAGVKAEKAEAKAAKEAGKPAPPAPFTKARQAAKAINFGVPGGLGAKKLAAYAKANYGVSLSQEEAQRLRDRLIKDVYPEIGLYLKDQFWPRLAANLGADPARVKAALESKLGCGAGLPWVLERVIEGRRTRGDGTSISPTWISEALDALTELAEDPWVREVIHGWGPGDRLKRRLLGETVVTRTGRVRRDTTYSEARNTPFQGLAADGGKLALWRAYQAGLKMVAFVHDEIVFEAPEERAEEEMAEACRVMMRAMAEVVGHGIPIEVEAKVSDTWCK
jgi:hypothetical protein